MSLNQENTGLQANQPISSFSSYMRIPNFVDTFFESGSLISLKKDDEPVHTIWGIIQEKLLPAFTGAGYKGCVEDMNMLVYRYYEKSTSDVVLEDIKTLIAKGISGLYVKAAGFSSDVFSSKMADLWIMLLSNVIPNVTAALVPILQSPKIHKLNYTDTRKLILLEFRNSVLWPLKDRLQGIL
jgi:hypothetical protein